MAAGCKFASHYRKRFSGSCFAPDEESAVEWLEAVRWPNADCHCGHCGSTATHEVPARKPMPCWCKDRGSCFSVRTGTNIEKSRLTFRKREFAVCLFATNLNGVASKKLPRNQGAARDGMVHAPPSARRGRKPVLRNLRIRSKPISAPRVLITPMRVSPPFVGSVAEMRTDMRRAEEVEWISFGTVFERDAPEMKTPAHDRPGQMSVGRLGYYLSAPSAPTM